MPPTKAEAIKIMRKLIWELKELPDETIVPVIIIQYRLKEKRFVCDIHSGIIPKQE